MEEIELKLQTNLNNNLLCNYMPLLFFKDVFFTKNDLLKVYCWYKHDYMYIDDYTIEKLYRNVEYRYISIFTNIITGYSDQDAKKLLTGWNYKIDILPNTICNLVIIKRKNTTNVIGLSYLAEIKKNNL